MLNNFVVSLEAVLPLFIMMGVGVLVKKCRLLSSTEVKSLNHMIFVVFFPLMMFSNIYGSDIKDAVNGKLIAFGIASILLIYLATVVVVMAIEKSPKSRGAMIQAIYRSNFVILGIPIAANIYGHGNLAVTAMMAAIVIPLYNILAVITLEVFRGGRPNPMNILKKTLRNPLIIGAFFGIVTVISGFQLPSVVESVIHDMSSVVPPLALVILGASINFRSIGRMGRNLIISVVGRLVVVPAVGLTAAALLGFRGISFVTLISIFAAPTAVSSFTMAETMDSDGELAGNCVVFSSAFSCITMFLWIFFFKNLGMF